MIALLGKKIGMTQIINAEGGLVPVTVIEAGPCVVTDLVQKDERGYKAVQIGFASIKEKHISRPIKGNFDKKKIAPKKYLREIKLTEAENYEMGQEIKVDIFKAGDLVDIQGRSIGKGFAGGMKRWHWAGGPNAHGSMFHRRIGSAGASSNPKRTWRGQTMPGHMGDVKKTVQNLEVIRVNADENILVVKGSVPGADNGLLYIRKSLKKPEGVKVRKLIEKKADKKKDAGKKKEDKPKK